MVTIPKFICVFVLVLFPSLASSFIMKRSGRMHKRQHGGGDARASWFLKRKLFFHSRGFQTVTVARRHESFHLECEAGGIPTPTIHWLKDGQRIEQGSYETVEDASAAWEAAAGGGERLGLSSTKSRLFLDCPTRRAQGEYTCVAQTPYMRKARATVVRVEGHGYSGSDSCVSRKRSGRGEAARVYMWTKSRLEYEHNTVQLFCRASGVPTPAVMWLDRFNNTLPTEADDGQYSIADNGDLIIRDISWFDNMGVYRCVAENEFGIDTQDTFLYPTAREDSFPLPS